MNTLEDELNWLYTRPEEDFKICIGVCSEFCCNCTKAVITISNGIEQEVLMCYITGNIIKEDKRVVVK